ncbi:MAG: pantoate--beta-alanine ligase [Myxococcota bacterium]
MEILRSMEAWRAWRDAIPVGERVGFVPTMGALHEGHLALMTEASKHADHVVVSVFVNPTQFGEGEDLEAYPRQLERDAELCASRGAVALFAPTEEMVYPPGYATEVRVPALTRHLCGPKRPGHFEGVATVVTKLFLMVCPHVAVFGEKDYQQLTIVRRMTEDLNLGVEIVGYPTVREVDGVAMSSRNRYMTAEERPTAQALSRGLIRAWEAWQDGARDGEALERLASEVLAGYPSARIDYVEVVHPGTLARRIGGARAIADDEGAVMAMAVFVGEARLLDNVRLDAPLPAVLDEIRRKKP